MRGYRKMIIGFTGIAMLFAGAYILPEASVSQFLYVAGGIIVTLITSNLGVHYFQNKKTGEKE